MSQNAAGYYERIDRDRYRPTEHAGGAWHPTEVHFSPLGGLIVHAIDLFRADRAGGHADDGLVLGRVAFEILGFLGTDECEIHVETVRPGRTIELIEATATIGGRIAVRARAWFLAAYDTAEVAGGAPDPLPDPDSLERGSFDHDWTGGYIHSLDMRRVAPALPGRAGAWLTTDVVVVAGEPASQHASFIALVDSANGIAIRQSPAEWLYPNVELSIHLHRQPSGRWVGLDTTVIFGPTGQGVTASVLHDLDGAVGFAHQMLTVRPR